MANLDSLKRDTGYALRTLRRTPGFTALAILILALGIGANTAIFSVVSAVVLRPLPFVEPDRLFVLWESFAANGGPQRVEPAPANFGDWKARSRSFEGLAGFVNLTYNLTGEGEPERLDAARTTPNLFSVVGLQPLVGRTFGDDEIAETTPVAVIGESLWIRRFGADPDVVGREITLDGASYTVIGVVPPDFKTPSTLFAGEIDVWVPTAFTAELARRDAYYMYVVGRLAPRVTRQQAQAEMTTIAAALAEEYPSNRGATVRVEPLHEHLARESRPTLLMLLGAVGILLLIACANVANLLLARSAGRAKEIALRRALGAGHGRVVRQLVTESAVLAGAGLALGTVLAAIALRYLARLVPDTFPGGTSPSLDWRVLAFGAAIALCTVPLFGVVPALATARVGLAGALKKVGGRGLRASGRFGPALVVAEITLTVVLLAAAGLLLRSYAQVLTTDPGFRAQSLLIAETALPASKYAELPARTAFYERVLERVRALPGVMDAGYANYAPLTFKGGRVAVAIEGGPAIAPENITEHIVSDRVATPGYLETLGLPLVGGRYFDSRDTIDSPLAAVINESMARRHWPEGDPVGKRFRIGQGGDTWLTVIGVVGDMRQMGLDVAPEPELYLAANQNVIDAPFFWPKHLLIRTRVDPLTLASAVRAAVWAVDAEQPVSSVRAMSDVIDTELANRNTQLTLVGAFAVLALVLAAAGLYGVLSYSVAQRTPEIGVRMALGAQQSTVLRSVVGGAMRLAVLGLVLGVVGALAVTRTLASFLFGVTPADPLTFAGTAALLLLVAAGAAYLPARRAARVDPMAALRDE